MTERGRAAARGVLGAAILIAVAAAPGCGSEPETRRAYSTTLNIDELGFDAAFRIRLYLDEAFHPVPGSVGHLVLVAADASRGRDAFFIPTDLAFEVGSEQVYRVEFEQASDLLGQSLGGRLRDGETQLGFFLIPREVDLARFLPASPESITVRYAHHRAPLHVAAAEEREFWERSFPQDLMAAGLNLWWTWIEGVKDAPAMSEGDRRFLAERVLPGQGHLLDEEHVSAEGLRNAILRVGDRKLLEAPSVQRMAPRYPAAARQAGAGGLVIALCYVTGDGAVGDAQVLASNTVHLLNLSALSAVMEWRFAKTQAPDGRPQDGWRLVPFQFRIAGGDSLVAGRDPREAADEGRVTPPSVLKAVEAEYPIEALNRRLEGTVVYRVQVDARGKMVSSTLEQGVHPLLDRAALDALERTRFSPARRGGLPVDGELLVPFTFRRRP